jgi:hypothetical protein
MIVLSFVVRDEIKHVKKLAFGDFAALLFFAAIWPVFAGQIVIGLLDTIIG